MRTAGVPVTIGRRPRCQHGVSTASGGWQERNGPAFVVEGPTDVAAVVAAGLCVVGRPFNSGGVEPLAELFGDWPPEREIVILGENDQKPDGQWPGRDGAESVARRLAALLGRRVSWAIVPPECKDVRDWLTAGARGESPWLDRGKELAAYLIACAVAIEPPGETGAGAPDDGPNDAPDNPHRLAVGFLGAASGGGPPYSLRFWRGDFYRYHGGAYSAVSDGELCGELTRWLRAEFVRLNAVERTAWDRRENEKGARPKVRPVTGAVVGNALLAIKGECMVPSSVEAPAWLDGVIGPDPDSVLSVANGLLDLHALADGRDGCLRSPTVSFFTLTALPFAFDPDAPPPAEWLQFLNDVWHDDRESVACLQEWFGYLLTPDTRQQKILFLIGPKRAGKGTIARVLGELIGPANVAAPTLGNLATNFGLSPLIGKSAAVIPDARLGGRADVATITERLLSISGGDALTIDRKHREPLTVKLGARFVILSNELPRLGDASGALAGRLILLQLTRSFYGGEDSGLFDRLRTEMPGILLWAVVGWRRLRDRGRFIQPRSGGELLREMEDLLSPVGEFVRERCIREDGAEIETVKLYGHWQEWCQQQGRAEAETEAEFGRALRAAVSALRKARRRVGAMRVHLYLGIRLRTPSDPDDDPGPNPGPPDGPPVHRGHGDQTLHAMEEGICPEGHEGEGGNGVRDTTRGHGGHGGQGGQAGQTRTDGRLFSVSELPD